MFDCVLCSESSPENLPAGAALSTSVSLPAGAREQDEVGHRNSVGKAKGKGKKSDNSPAADSDLEVKMGVKTKRYAWGFAFH